MLIPCFEIPTLGKWDFKMSALSYLLEIPMVYILCFGGDGLPYYMKIPLQLDLRQLHITFWKRVGEGGPGWFWISQKLISYKVWGLWWSVKSLNDYHLVSANVFGKEVVEIWVLRSRLLASIFQFFPPVFDFIVADHRHIYSRYFAGHSWVER